MEIQTGALIIVLAYMVGMMIIGYVVGKINIKGSADYLVAGRRMGLFMVTFSLSANNIGGDRFGNREGLLPEQTGRSYTECDINTDGADSRGAERLIFSNDGLYFYTSDHYASFTELTVDGGTVVWSR